MSCYKIQGVAQIKLKQIEALKHRINVNNMQQFGFHLTENILLFLVKKN
jgi:hypothetical protein